jgi:protein-tyrosine phosphatase
LEEASNLYLNMIDPSVPLFMPPLFSEFLRFARAQWNGGKHVLIHCNQGESRAPSLALLFLAKVPGALPAESFDVAKQAYLRLDPVYSPGQGIQTYLREHWNDW